MKAAKVYQCKIHQYRHPYTVCPCGCQYCARIWQSCPRCRPDAGGPYSTANGVHVARPRTLEKEKEG